MKTVTIYHNPNCSKSRAVLALLEENDIDPEIIYYLETPPSADVIRDLATMLGVNLRGLLRKNEPEYEDLGLGNKDLAESIVLDLVCKHPQLLQRPIVVHDGQAVIGRPPEKVLRFIADIADIADSAAD